MVQKEPERNRELLPLISVIIASYNYGRYIRTAIDSVLTQTYPYVEVIVIDDGSTDDTREIVSRIPGVSYFYHSNRGVSASRNAGISASSGDYLVFLDADDWLSSTALEDNYQVIKTSPELAFVSGNYYLLQAGKPEPEPVVAKVHDNHYLCLLKSNYIGMLAAVMFPRWVLEEIGFDESVKACEDYDLFLNIARRYPVCHHQKFIATYYHHSHSLSHDFGLMMTSIREVICKQCNLLQNDGEREAYRQGYDQWKEYRNLIGS